MSESLGQSLQLLSPAERAEQYRQFAAEAMLKAQTAIDPDHRAEYFAMATSWHTMAMEAERAVEGDERRDSCPADRADTEPNQEAR